MGLINIIVGISLDLILNLFSECVKPIQNHSREGINFLNMINLSFTLMDVRKKVKMT